MFPTVVQEQHWQFFVNHFKDRKGIFVVKQPAGTTMQIPFGTYHQVFNRGPCVKFAMDLVSSDYLVGYVENLITFLVPKAKRGDGSVCDYGHLMKVVLFCALAA
jgi:hypothetical protein